MSIFTQTIDSSNSGGDHENTAHNAVDVGALPGGFLGTYRFDFRAESPGLKTTWLTENSNGDYRRPDLSPPLRSSTEPRWRKTVSVGVRRATKDLEDFPPLLSTLDKSGRPIFNLVKERSDGRLTIATVRNDKPRIVRTYGRDGGLRMEMVKCIQEYDNNNNRERKDGEVGEEQTYS